MTDLAALMGTNLQYQFLVNLLSSLTSLEFVCVRVRVTLAKHWLCIHGMK